MEEYKERVIQERLELNEKRKKLIQFMQNSPVFKELTETAKCLLRTQNSAMEIYSDTLRERILIFEEEEKEKIPA